MFRQTFIGGLLAAFIAPMGVAVNSILSTPDKQPEHNEQLAESLASLSHTLVSFESRQSGSEKNLTEQLKALTEIVADTQRANQSQIDSLTNSLKEVKQIAAEESETFKELVKSFSDDLEKKFVKAEVDDTELPAEGVSTLDVTTTPSDAGDRPQDFSDAARRIVALEAAVKELQSRSVSSSSTVKYDPTPTYYGPSMSTVSSGGSTGSYATQSYSGGSTGSYASRTYQAPMVVQSSGYTNYASTTPSYTPTYYYSAAPATTVVQRRGVFRSSTAATNGTCRIVNGRMVCP